MGHYGCNDLLSILSSVYSAFFTVGTVCLILSSWVFHITGIQIWVRESFFKPKVRVDDSWTRWGRVSPPDERYVPYSE